MDFIKRYTCENCGAGNVKDEYCFYPLEFIIEKGEEEYYFCSEKCTKEFETKIYNMKQIKPLQLKESDFNYLLYVRKYSILSNKDELCVYQTNSKDIFHTMGEMYYRSLEHISRIDFVEWTVEKVDYWKKEQIDIKVWVDKYE